MLDLTHIRSFIAVATELNFGRAAKRLNMTQPPLSRQIQLLERELDVRLFLRTSRSVELTPAGRAFLAEARQLLAHGETAMQAARRAAKTETGALTIGFIGATTYAFLPRLVSRARLDCPSIALTFREMEAPAQLEALALGGIDLGLVRPLAEPHPVRSLCVMREKMALALPLDHPLAVRRRPMLSQLDGEPIVMYSREARYLNRLLNEAFDKAGIRPRHVQEMSHSQAVLSLVSTGLGLAIVPEETRNACFDNIVFRPIDLGRGVAVELHALWRTENRNPALAAMTALLESMAADPARPQSRRVS